MAQKPESEHDAFGIARVGKRKWGYDVAQVDAFLERAHSLYEDEDVQLTPKDIQGASFDMRRGGYEYKQVDAALDRLERAVVDKQTAWEISSSGRIASKARSESLLRQIADHANRTEGQRFAPGKPKTPSYDRKQVDGLVDSVVTYASAQLQAQGAHGAADAADEVADDSGRVEQLDANKVSHAVFTQRKGAKGYDERQVDYFLSACAHLLTRIESFERVSGYGESAPGRSQAAPLTALGEAGQPHVDVDDARSHGFGEADDAPAGEGQATQIIGVAPLFSGDAAERRMPPSYAPEAREDDHMTSFDALHKQEQAIFSSPTESDPSKDASAAGADFISPSEARKAAGTQDAMADVLDAGNGIASGMDNNQIGRVPAGRDGDASDSASLASLASSTSAHAAQATGADVAAGAGNAPGVAEDGTYNRGVGRRGAHGARLPREHEILPEPEGPQESNVVEQSDGGPDSIQDTADHVRDGYHAARSISDIAPITPAPRSEHALHTTDTNDVHHAHIHESSIDALAHMAQTSSMDGHQEPATDLSSGASPRPFVPDFAMPHFTTDAQHLSGSESSGDGAVTGERDRGHDDAEAADRDAGRDALFPSVFGETQDDFSFNIPDLSFPTFNQGDEGHDAGHAAHDAAWDDDAGNRDDDNHDAGNHDADGFGVVGRAAEDHDDDDRGTEADRGATDAGRH